MTSREAEQAIIAELRPVLVEHGFRRRRTAWFRHDRQFLQMLEMEAGQREITVRLGAMYRPMNRVTHPATNDCHISVGLGSIVGPDTDWGAIRAYQNWTSANDDLFRSFVTITVQVALQVLDQWRSEDSLRQFLRTSLGLRCKVRQELAEYLAQHDRGR